MKAKKGTVSRGRPREFDEEKALDRAMHVFWRKGYEGASLPELTDAMGINKPSLYAAFGNKEQLFRRALDRYAQLGDGMIQDAMSQPTARGFIERLLTRAAEGVSTGPGGCMLVQSALVCGDHAQPIRQELSRRRAAMQDVMRQRLQAAIDQGELPKKTDPAGLARYFAAVLNGIAVQSAGGAKGPEMKDVVRTAMRAWPDK